MRMLMQFQKATDLFTRHFVANRPNQALEATADRREKFHMTTSTLSSEACRVIVSGASAWSR